MKNLIILFALSVTIFLVSCQPEGFQDLTPNDGHQEHYWFNGVEFSSALLIQPGLPDTIFEIAQPDYLIDRSMFTYDRIWYTTDTFAFDPGDFEAVLSVLTGTILDHEPRTTYPTPDLSQTVMGGRIAWSMPNKFWIIRWGPAWIQISREKVGGGLFSSYKYTANAVWMEAKLRVPDGDVS